MNFAPFTAALRAVSVLTVRAQTAFPSHGLDPRNVDPELLRAFCPAGVPERGTLRCSKQCPAFTAFPRLSAGWFADKRDVGPFSVADQRGCGFFDARLRASFHEFRRHGSVDSLGRAMEDVVV